MHNGSNTMKGTMVKIHLNDTPTMHVILFLFQKNNLVKALPTDKVVQCGGGRGQIYHLQQKDSLRLDTWLLW